MWSTSSCQSPPSVARCPRRTLRTFRKKIGESDDTGVLAIPRSQGDGPKGLQRNADRAIDSVPPHYDTIPRAAQSGTRSLRVRICRRADHVRQDAISTVRHEAQPSLVVLVSMGPRQVLPYYGCEPLAVASRRGMEYITGLSWRVRASGASSSSTTASNLGTERRLQRLGIRTRRRCILVLVARRNLPNLVRPKKKAKNGGCLRKKKLCSQKR